MIHNILIATSKAPTQARKELFIEALKGHTASMDCKLLAVTGMIGPGCYNMALKVEGERWEEVGNFVTMALGPMAKWCLTTEDFEGFDLKELKE